MNACASVARERQFTVSLQWPFREVHSQAEFYLNVTQTNESDQEDSTLIDKSKGCFEV